MRVSIDYRTEYQYESEVSFSPHLFRWLPKIEPHLAVEEQSFETNPGADVQYRRDLFDNLVATCIYPGTHRQLFARLRLKVRLTEKNPFHFLLAPHATELPFDYTLHERTVLAPFLEPRYPRVELPFWQFAQTPVVTALAGLNTACFDHLKYERRDQGAARTPAETLAAGGGACRDFAVLLAETLRAIGIAARLVSGYLWEEQRDRAARAEGALHAWTEAFLPGAGWVGLDPANGTFASHGHIPTAVGLDPDDVAPVAGRYFADSHVASSMSVALAVSSCTD